MNYKTKEVIKLDLTRDFDSYLFGLILADGSLSFQSRNRGRVRVELSYDDKDVLEKIHDGFHLKLTIRTRERSTHFKQDFKTIVWSCYLREFREDLLRMGMPKKNKSINSTIPICKYVKNAFWRGFLDGDGSIGMTGNNQPFISAVIKSNQLAK